MNKSKKLLLSSLFLCGAQFSHGASLEYFNDQPFLVNDSEALSNARTGALYACNPWERRTITGQAEIDIYVQGKKGQTQRVEPNFQAPGYFVIESVKRIQTSKFGDANGWVTMTQPNSYVSNVVNYSDVYNNAESYLFDSLTKIDVMDIDAEVAQKLKLEIEQIVSTYQNYSRVLSSTHGEVVHHGIVKSKGRFREGSSYEGYVDINVICMPPEIVQQALLEELIKEYIDDQLNTVVDDISVDDITSISSSGSYLNRYPGERAFDDSSRSAWISDVWESPAYLEFGFDKGVELSEYSIHFSNGSLTGRAPKVFELQGKDQSGNWIALDNPAPQTNWKGTEVRTFSVPANSGYYEDFRLFITEDNDNRAPIVVISIGELTFKGKSQ